MPRPIVIWRTHWRPLADSRNRFRIPGKPCNSSPTIRNLGVGLARSGRLDEAIERFQKALAGSPDSAAIHANLAGALIEKGRLDEAIPHFEQALKSEPNSPQLNSAMGRLLAARGRFAEAIPYMEKAAGSGEPTLLGMLSAVYAQTGRIEDALRVARRGLQIASDRHERDLIAEFERSIGNNRSGTPEPAPGRA